VLDTDLSWLIGAYVASVIGIWSLHGGMARFTEGTTGVATAVTQVSGLAASAVGLVGLLFTARPSVLERRYGLDQLFNWHRVLGEAMAMLVGVHVTAAVFEWQVDGRWGAAIADLTGREPYMAGATVGALLIGVVTVTSLRSVRNRLSYETWYFLHLTAYLGFALSFGHQIVTGADFADDAIARSIWITLHLAVAAALVWGSMGASAPIGGEAAACAVDRTRGARHRVDPSLGSASARQAGHARLGRSVLLPAGTHPRRLVAFEPVLALGVTGHRWAAVHDQGAW
jgi:DMSO/TMAO reductase YedYZ heme-binding membrane subunit